MTLSLGIIIILVIQLVGIGIAWGTLYSLARENRKKIDLFIEKQATITEDVGKIQIHLAQINGGVTTAKEASAKLSMDVGSVMGQLSHLDKRVLTLELNNRTEREGKEK